MKMLKIVCCLFGQYKLTPCSLARIKLRLCKNQAWHYYCLIPVQWLWFLCLSKVKFLRRGTSEPLETHFILWKTKVSLSCLSKLYFLEYLDYVWKNDFDFVHVLLRAVQRQDVQSSMQRYKAW